jgi:hypothetical protein
MAICRNAGFEWSLVHPPRPLAKWHVAGTPSMPPCARPADCKPNVCGGKSSPRSSRRFDTLIWNTKFADFPSANGMKRDVCVDEPDSFMPAVRFRPAARHESAESAFGPRQTGADCYQPDSTFTNASPRPHPRAQRPTHSLSHGSPAIPPHVNTSVRHQ